jgi:hypothetical protein
LYKPEKLAKDKRSSLYRRGSSGDEKLSFIEFPRRQFSEIYSDFPP